MIAPEVLIRELGDVSMSPGAWSLLLKWTTAEALKKRDSVNGNLNV